MDSALSKEGFVKKFAVDFLRGNLDAGLAVTIALIEIREAIEANTAVQQTIAERAGKIEEQGVEMLKGFEQVRGDLQSMQSSLESQRRVIAELVKTVGNQADRLHEHENWLTAQKGIVQRLAEEKQDRPTVLNGPDTALDGE